MAPIERSSPRTSRPNGFPQHASGESAAERAAAGAKRRAEQALREARLAQEAAAAAEKKAAEARDRAAAQADRKPSEGDNVRAREEAALQSTLKEAESLTAQAGTLSTGAVAAQEKALAAQKAANDAARQAKAEVPFALADKVADTFEAAELDAAEQKTLLGAEVAVTQAQRGLHDAQRVNAAKGEEAAATLFTKLLEQNEDPEYRSALSVSVPPGVLQAAALAAQTRAVTAGLDEANALHDHHREGLGNKVGGFLLDRVSGRGGNFDEAVDSANEYSKEAKADGKIDAGELEKLTGLVVEAQEEGEGYHEFKNKAASVGAAVGATAAAVVATALTGGAALPLVIVAAGAAGAGGTVLGRGVIEGSDYEASEMGRDALIGFAGGAAGGAVSTLGAGARLMGAAGTMMRVSGTGAYLIPAAIDGVAVGAASSAAATAVNPETWKQGVDQGLVSLARNTAFGAALGGAVGTGAGAIAGRAAGQTRALAQPSTTGSAPGTGNGTGVATGTGAGAPGTTATVTTGTTGPVTTAVPGQTVTGPGAQVPPGGSAALTASGTPVQPVVPAGQVASASQLATGAAGHASRDQLLQLQRGLQTSAVKAYEAPTFAARNNLHATAVADESAELALRAAGLPTTGGHADEVKAIFEDAARRAGQKFEGAFDAQGKPIAAAEASYKAAMNGAGEEAYAVMPRLVQKLMPATAEAPEAAAQRIVRDATVGDVAEVVRRDLGLPTGMSERQLVDTLNKIIPEDDYFHSELATLPVRQPGAAPLGTEELSVLGTGVRAANATWKSGQAHGAAWEGNTSRIDPSARGGVYNPFDQLKRTMYDESVAAAKAGGATQAQAEQQGFARIVFEVYKDLVELKKVAVAAPPA